MKKVLLVFAVFLSLTTYSQIGWKYQNSNLQSVIQINQNGEINPINKDTVYATADGGRFLKTYDGGVNWITQNIGFAESFYDLSFCNTDTGFAVGQNGTIIRTFNGGTNWDSLTSGTKKNLYSISSRSQNNLWVVGDSGTILNSHDYGNTWIKKDTLTTNQLNSIRFRNSNIGFIAGSNGTLLGTINGGTTWNILSIATTSDLFSLAITSNYTYLLTGNAFGGINPFFTGCGLFKTNNNINWINTSAYMCPSGLGAQKLYFQNDSLGFYIGAGCPTCSCPCVIEIYKTIDYGQTWTCSLNGDAILGSGLYSDIAFVTDSIGYAFSGDYIIKTIDGGSCTLLSVNELNNNSSLKIFPNPFSTQTTISINGQSKINNAEFIMYDIFGREVKKLSIFNSPFTINRDGLPSGLYFLRLTQDGKTLATDKLVITD